MKNNKKLLLLSYFLGIITAVFLFCTYYFIRSPEVLHKSIYIADGLSKLSDDEIESLAKLAYSGQVIVPEVLQSSIASYYNTLITILVALLGLFSLLGFLYIKGAAKRDIEEELNNLLTNLDEKHLSKIAMQVREELANDYVTYDELDKTKNEILTEVEIYYENLYEDKGKIIHKE
jgi:hypothetical protein